jgi:hypothetical protein
VRGRRGEKVPAERRAEAAERLEEYAAHLGALRAATKTPLPTPEWIVADLGELRKSLSSA